jgi:hypothetical protein
VVYILKEVLKLFFGNRFNNYIIDIIVGIYLNLEVFLGIKNNPKVVFKLEKKK